LIFSSLCKHMMPSVDRLKKETDVKLKRLEIWLPG